MPLKVYFDIPYQIALGLNSGRLERVGGIIRDAGSKQIVAWLRESGKSAFADPNATTGMLGAMQTSSGNLASVTAGILDAAITARSHHVLMNQMKVVERLSTVAAVTGILNLGLGAVTFVTMIQNASKLVELINAQAELDRTLEREAVIEYLDLLKLLSTERQNLASELAVLPMIKCRNNLLHNYEQSIGEKDLTIDQIESAVKYLVMTMQLDVLHVRNYLETDETTAARARLKACLSDFRERTRALVTKLLGEYPARYFHREVSSDDFRRYLRIEEWLRGQDDILMDLVEERRADFWNNDATPSLGRGVLDFLRSNNAVDHLASLTMAEFLIENLQRLEGYEIEIASLRMSVEEWDQLTNLDDQDFAVVVDLDMLDELDRT